MGHLGKILLFTLLILGIYGSSISIIQPSEISSKAQYQSIPAHISPIGFRPLSGSLQGKIILANPIGACAMIKDLHSFEEDIFVLADDSQCLESIKAKNIANSGAYVGIIKQNINNTLHDKEVKLVHIPIVELSPDNYELLRKVVESDQRGKITLSIDFTQKSLTHKANLEVWFSPTELSTYTFLIGIKPFLMEQTSQVSFSPHYVLQSQRQIKSFIGCYSSGKYCPTEIEFQGKYEGENIVQETLRQIILWKMSQSQWWSYIQSFYKGCLLEYPQIFQNSTQLRFCSQNSMVRNGIDLQAYQQQYNKSFVGSRKEADDNTYLLEERQLFIKEQITSHPIGLINKKPISLQVQPVSETICKIEGQSSKGSCKVNNNHLSTSQIFIILLVIFGVFVIVASIYRLYIYFSMKSEIKSEVDKTLQQYYRYIETFQSVDGELNSRKNKPVKEKSRPLTEQLEQVQPKVEDNSEKPENQFQLREVNNK